MNLFLIIVVVAVVLLLAYVASTYNKLISEKNKVDNQWSQIDVELKRRADLIPNLVETVKGYAKHEKNTLEGVIEARNKAISAKTVEEISEANNNLTNALGRLFALSEAYPELKANENFLNLQKDLKETEDKITYARQFYNDAVMKFNTLIERFPSNIIANSFGFKKFEFFKIAEKEKEVPKVEF